MTDGVHRRGGLRRCARNDNQPRLCACNENRQQSCDRNDNRLRSCARSYRRPRRRAAVWVACALLTVAFVPAAAESVTRRLTAEAYIQVRGTAVEGAADLLAVRRAKAMLTWRPSSASSLYVQTLYKVGNHSSSDGRLWVQELWVKQRVGSGSLTAGQLKPPFGLERFTPDWALETPDRSQMTDHLVPDGGLAKSFTRDVGLVWDVGEQDRGWTLSAGLMLGNGALAEPYRGNGPLLAARLVRRWRHGRDDWIQVGASASTRHDRDIDFSGALPGTKPLGTDHFHGRDTRWGFDAAADEGRWRLRAEYMAARLTGTVRQPVIEADGWYAQAACVLSRRWVAVVKQEAFDPNTAIVNRNDIGWTTVGVNWLLRGDREKLQAAYVFKRERGAEQAGDALMLQYQRFF